MISVYAFISDFKPVKKKTTGEMHICKFVESSLVFVFVLSEVLESGKNSG